MTIMKKYKNFIIFLTAAVALLAFVFWWGGNSPGVRGWHSSSVSSASVSNAEPLDLNASSQESRVDAEDSTDTPTLELSSDTAEITEDYDGQTISASTPTETTVPVVQSTDESYPTAADKETSSEAVKDKYLTTPVPDGKPQPIEPQSSVISRKPLTCTLSVDCHTILDNIDWLDSEKLELVPKDGVIFAEKTVTFYEGESVFNLLLREMKKNKIHMEFRNTPIYNSAYIEGINNIYEFDCGELSGWMYKVNGWFPNYGCSRYGLKQGDKVEWIYTCSLGSDIGDTYTAAGGQKDE